ncbi:hypothetical protein OPIT5_16980 [Opitutaceae bacterium TAV5]|nr:hypothetical protein OPIT5_16980 [Opitutaceae bacterium TAV5]
MNLRGMRQWPLRWRLSLFIALLTLLVLAVFCSVTGVMLYYEQIDVLEDVMTNATEEEIEDEAWDVLEDLFSAFAWALPVAMLLLGAGSWWMLRRELRSLQGIIAATGRIDSRSLGVRLPAPSGPREIIRLTSVLNDMLARIDGAFRQTIRFTADASHELRTPLTIIRGELETALRRSNGNVIPAATAAGLLEHVQRLSAITEQLLLLTQVDAGRLTLAKTGIDLARLVEDVLEDASILAEPHGITLETDLDPHISIEADPAALRRVLLNLVDNAIKYNHSGGRVTCTLRPGHDTPDRNGAIIEIANTGAGIHPGMEEKIFDRFVRIDESRSRDTGGSGLGLSICREIITAHGGRLHCITDRPGWTLMRLVL